jgi:hypothetical protein
MATSNRVPAWVTGVKSLVAHYQVHVVLIQGYPAVHDEWYWREVLPSAVDLQVWSDAVPWRLSADGRLVEDAAALRWQHRHVLKDRLLDYDVFAVFSDGIQLSTTHIDFFVERSRQWQNWGATADWPEYPRVVPGVLPLHRTMEDRVAETPGPFDPQELCCGDKGDATAGAVLSTTTTSLVWPEAPDLLLQVRVGQFQDQKFALVPASAQGWFVTRNQLGRLLQACPTFLPPWDDDAVSKEAPCLWQRLIPLDASAFAQAFVYEAAPWTADESLILGPNALWHEWNLASVETT